MTKKYQWVIIILMLAALLVGGCAPEPAPEPTQAPTVIPSPTPVPPPTATPIYPGIWGGSWNIWAGMGEDSEDHELLKYVTSEIIVEGSYLTTEVLIQGEAHTVTAEISQDGIAAVGEWSGPDGQSGTAVMLISADQQSFAGNFNGTDFFCGSRDANKKPKDCITDISADWDGAWVVWIGPDEIESLVFLEQDGQKVGIMLYDFTGTVSSDGLSMTGEINEAYFSGQMEARMLDNQAQFRGNIGGLFPFCGVRPGGPKPDPCLGP